MFKGLILAERLLLIVTLFTVSLYLILGIPFRNPLDTFWLQTKGAILFYVVGQLSLYVAGTFLAGFVAIRHKSNERGKHFLEQHRLDYLSRDAMLRHLRLITDFTIILIVFSHLKHLTPLIHRRVFDLEISHLEGAIFGGRLASEALIQWIGTAPASFLSASYDAFFYFVSFGCLCVIMQRDADLSYRFMTAAVLLWPLSMLIVYLFPTLGPCFAFPERFSMLPHTGVTDMQRTLWEIKLHLDAFPASSQGIFFISGFPSLHIAAPLLFALFLRRVSVVLCAICWIFFLLTWVSTLYFGWHYLIDNIAGAVYAIFVFNQSVNGPTR